MKTEVNAQCDNRESSPWRSVKGNPPKKEDGDRHNGSVLWRYSNGLHVASNWKDASKDRTHWMPIPPIPVLTPEQKERERFEAWAKSTQKFQYLDWMGGMYANQEDNLAWLAWRAASAD